MPRAELRPLERPVAYSLAAVYGLAFLVMGILYHQATDRLEPSFREWPAAAEAELYEQLIDPLSIAVLATDFDPETMLASFRLLPQPIGDLGDSLGLGSAWFLNDIDLEIIVNSVDGLDGSISSALYFEGNPSEMIPYASIRAELDVELFPGYRTRPSTRWYPFDSYAHVLTVFASQRPWSEEPLIPATDSAFLLNWDRMSVAPYAYSVPVGGFDFRFRPGSLSSWQPGQTGDVEAVLEDWQVGFASFEVYTSRTRGIKILVALVSLALFLNLLAVVYLTARVVSTERPPSAQVLIWVAALSFAAVAIRDTMPAAPPPGIMLDYLFFFPTLLAASIATVVLVFTWSRRSDYVA